MKKKTTRKKKTAGTARKKKTTAARPVKAGAARKPAARRPAARKTSGASAARRGRTPAHSYQEGSIESVGGRPSGTDVTDRSGDGTRPAPGKRPTEKGRDSFVSSEISDLTSIRGKDPRTRS